MKTAAICALIVFVTAATNCPSRLYELDTWTGESYVQVSGAAVSNTFSVAPGVGKLSISLWVQLAPSQASDNAVLYQFGTLVPVNGSSNVTRYGDALSVYWDAKDSRLGVQLFNNATADGGNMTITSLLDDGTVALNTRQYRNVVVILDATMGTIAVTVNSVLTGVVDAPALRAYGLHLLPQYSVLTIGADYFGNSNAEATFTDLTVIDDIISLDGAKYLTQFRVPFEQVVVGPSNQSMCIVQPCSYDTSYPFHNTSVQTFYFTPSGFSMPGAKFISPYLPYFFPVYASPLSLGPQVFAMLNVTSPSWTSSAFAQGSCGAMQSGVIQFPNNMLTYNVMVTLQSASTFPLGTTINITNTYGMLLAVGSVVDASTTTMKLPFVFQGGNLPFNVSSSSSSSGYCIARVSVAERGGVLADPPILFTGSQSQLSIYAGVGLNDSIALLQSMNCLSAPQSSLLSPTPVMTYGMASYVSVSVPEMATSGVNYVCVYPGGVVSAQAYVASRCYAQDNTATFLCNLFVAPLPSGNIPLNRTWITNLLHLGAEYTDVISHGLFETDYFIEVGGEKRVTPQPGDVFDSPAMGTLVWTPMSEPSGEWGLYTPSIVKPSSNYSLAEWVQYMSMGLHASVTQTISVSVRACSAVKVFVDGVNVFQLNPSYSNMTNATDVVYHSFLFTVKTGWHQVMVKLWRAPSVTTSIFALRFDNGNGLSWNFYIPSNSSANTTYPGVCLQANKSMPCLAGEANASISHHECVGMGCCYDPANTDMMCFASSTAPQMYRTDGRCGLGWPSAASNVSICSPQSSTGSFCCSQFEWCGSTRQHCDCSTCTNAKYTALPAPRCNYVPWGSNARCLGATRVPMGAMSIAGCRMTCDFTPGCIAFNAAVVRFQYTCTLTLATGGSSISARSCPVTITDTTAGTLYLKSCSMCSFTRNVTTGAQCTSPSDVAPYGNSAPNPRTYMSYAQCQAMCMQAVACKGVQYNSTSGQCGFVLNSPCRSLVNATADTSVAYYTCASDTRVVPTPLPTAPNTTSVTFLGCYQDFTSTFLSQPVYAGFETQNVFTANYNPNMANLSLDACGEYCWNLGAPFFAVSAGRVCTCGVRMPQTLPPASESYCTTVCPGNASQLCGGPQGASVYLINYFQGDCEPGFVYFNNNCYQYFGQMGSSDMQDWHSARQACHALGASLVSIHSRRELQFVTSFAYVSNSSNVRITWTGGYEDRVDNSYMWEDGSDWDFANWRIGEPNGKNFVESCLTAFSNYPTPYKGSFNDDGCEKPYPYVCKMPVEGSSTYPAILAVVVDGSVACAPQGGLASLNADLAAWYSFDTIAMNSTFVVPDLSANRRDLTFQVSDAATGVITGPEVPTFVPGIVANAAYLNGTGFFLPYIAKYTAPWDLPHNQISISVWMQQASSSSSSNQIAVSKSSTNNASDTSVPAFEWAIAFRNGALCMIVGPYRACAQAPPAQTWTHVVGTFDGNLISLYLNATLTSSYDISVNSNVTFHIAKNPNTTMSIGYRSATPMDTSRIFQGLLDDVRIFTASLSRLEVGYLFTCTPNGAPNNVINLYDSEVTTLLVVGEGLSMEDVFTLSLSGCDAGTPVDDTTTFTSVVNTYVGYVSIAGVSPPPATNVSAAPNFAVCNVNQLDPTVVYNDAYFEIMVTSIQSLNGYVQQMVVNNTQFPLLVQLQGLNLATTQIIATAMDSACSLLDATYPVTSVSADGTSAYVTINRPALISDVIHICWGSSSNALGDASASGGDVPSPMPAAGTNLVNTGLSILMMDPNGLQFKRLAAVDGTTPISRSTIQSGMSGSAGLSNYFLACSDADYYEDNYLLVIQMGMYEDYLIPQPGVSVCDLLLTSPWTSTHMYSSTSPLEETYDGSATLVPPTNVWSFLGGSSYGFPSDGRQYLSAWGTYFALSSATFLGGFGQSTPQQIPEWYQAYSIVVWSVPNTTYYLQLSLAPGVVTPGAFAMIEAKLLDNHRNIATIPVTFRVTYAAESYTMASSNGLLQFNTTLPLSLAQLEGQTFTITVAVVNVPTIVNGNNRTFECTVGSPLPSGMVPINGSDSISTFLHFGNQTFGVESPYYYIGMYSDWFAGEGGEASMQPVAGEESTAQSDSFMGSADAVTNTWQEVYNPTGYFLNTAAPNTVQFFAGALYSPVQQNVRLIYSCDDGVMIYLDGNVVVQDFEPSNQTAISDDVTIAPGWHQVFIKLVNEYTLSLLELKVLGTGLGWATSIPADIPENSQLLIAGEPLLQALMIGPDAFVGAFSVDYVNETTTRPNPGTEVAPGLIWTDTTAVNGTWTIDAMALTNGLDFAVTYLAFGLYAAVPVTVVMEMQVPSMMAIYYDGYNVLTVSGSEGKEFNDTFYVDQGWHQVIIKLGARAGTVQTFRMVPEEIDGPLAWSLIAPYMLPSGVYRLSDDEPLMYMMGLVTNATMETPSPSQGEVDYNRATGIIPFGPASLSASIAAADIDVSAQFMPFDFTSVPSFPQASFEWVPYYSSSADWGENGMGGSFNEYFAITLYASADMPGLESTVFHGSAGYAMWIDGVLIGSHPQGSGLASSSTFGLSEGYHQLLIKMQAPSDFSVFQVGDTMTFNQANTYCHNQAFKQVCSQQALCPYGLPRQGFVPTNNGSFFMPYRDQNNGWLQTGTGGNNTATCQTWMSSHKSQPTWGTSSTPQSIRGSVACCGSRMPPQISISFSTENVPSDGVLGWAFGAPATTVETPTITSLNPRGRHQTIVMNTTTPGATIYYTTDYSYPTAMSIKYTGPVNVTSSTFFVAFAVLNSRSQSDFAYYMVNILPMPTIDRSVCISNAACYVPALAVDPQWYFVFVSTQSNSSTLAKLIKSITAAASMTASGVFSGLVQVQSDNGLLVPGLNTGSYYAISYDGSGSGTVVGTLQFSPLNVETSVVVASSDALMRFSGGVQSGDGVLFLDPLYGSGNRVACSSASCARAFSDYTSSIDTVRVDPGGYFDAEVDLDGFGYGYLKCLCVCASGAYSPPGNSLPQDFNLMTEIVSAVAIHVQVVPPLPEHLVLEEVYPSVVGDEQLLFLEGNFTQNDTLTDFSVQFTAGNYQNTMIIPAPTCSMVFANSTLLTCLMNVRVGTNGRWWVSLFYRGIVVDSNATFKITAVPPAPTVSGATGACASVSMNCVSGSVLTISGTNFDTATITNNMVVFTPWTTTMMMMTSTNNNSAAVTCGIANVTPTLLLCLLNVPEDAINGTYNISVVIVVTPLVSITADAGTLALGAGNAPGYQPPASVPTPVPTPAPIPTNAPAGSTPQPSSSPSGPTSSPSPNNNASTPSPTYAAASSTDSKAGVIGGVLGGVIGVLLIAFVVIRYRYTLIPKEVVQSKEMDYIEEQLMEEAHRTNSPRGRSGSLEPEPVNKESSGKPTRYTAPAPPPTQSINNM